LGGRVSGSVHDQSLFSRIFTWVGLTPEATGATLSPDTPLGHTYQYGSVSDHLLSGVRLSSTRENISQVPAR
jgi:hypothetical protein